MGSLVSVCVDSRVDKQMDRHCYKKYLLCHRDQLWLMLLKPTVRTEIARCAFSQAASTIWNNLPLDSHSAVTYERFRSVTKKHFYELAFINWSCDCLRSHDSFLLTTYGASSNTLCYVTLKLCLRCYVLFHPQLYLNCISTYVLILFSHGYSATLAAKLIIKLDLTWLDV